MPWMSISVSQHQRLRNTDKKHKQREEEDKHPVVEDASSFGKLGQIFVVLLLVAAATLSSHSFERMIAQVRATSPNVTIPSVPLAQPLAGLTTDGLVPSAGPAIAVAAAVSAAAISQGALACTLQGHFVGEHEDAENEKFHFSMCRLASDDVVDLVGLGNVEFGLHVT